MIKCEITKNGTKTEVCGSYTLIKAELVTLIKNVRENFAETCGKESADNDIQECVRYAFMEEKEIKREAEEKKRMLMEKLGVDEECIRKLVEMLCV